MGELLKLLEILESFTCGGGDATSPCGDDNDDYQTQWNSYCEDDELEDEPEDELEESIREQDEAPVETPQATEVPEEMPTEEIPTGDETGTMPAMPGEEDEVPKDPETLGRIYELKKIYSRLVSIESFLNDVSEPMLLKLRNFVSESIELFQLMINNIDTFKNKTDEIIILYYKFLRIVYELLKQFYENENDEDKEKIKRGK